MVKSATKTPLKIVKSEKPAALPPPTNGEPLDAETFHAHVGFMTQMKARKDAAAKLYKKTRTDAAHAGLVMEEVDEYIRMRDMDPEKAKEKLKRKFQYMTWGNMTRGLNEDDLFAFADAKDSSEAQAEQEGYIEGLEGKTADGDRYDSANEIGQARLRGHARGQTVLQDRFIAKSEAANLQ